MLTCRLPGEAGEEEAEAEGEEAAGAVADRAEAGSGGGAGLAGEEEEAEGRGGGSGGGALRGAAVPVDVTALERPGPEEAILGPWKRSRRLPTCAEAFRL